jgi:undecaprenyl-diphosphatase
LALFYRRDWVAILRGIGRSAQRRRIETSEERLGWLLILATIPAGLTGIIFEHKLRVLFAKPTPASAFLVVNGFILLGGEVLRRRSEVQAQRELRRAARRNLAASVDAVRMQDAAPVALASAPGPRRSLAELSFKEALIIGVAQILALFAGISRSGVTIVAGLVRGLDHEDAARFSFLLATPVILAAGVYKLHDLVGPNGNGVRGQTFIAAVFAGVAAWFSVRFLAKWFTSRTLLPFGIYCIVAGSLLLIRFA